MEIRLADDMPQSATPPIREKPTFTELRGEPRPEPTPENASNVQHIKQTGTWPPRGTEPYSRGIEQPIRERPAVTPAHDLPSAPQEQSRQVFVEKQAQLAQNPSIESIYPSESAAPVPPQLPVSEASAITPKRQPVTAGSGKSASPTPQPVQPLAEHPPTIREKPKPNAAPRERPQRGIDIRTRDTEQISAPTAQSKTPASKTATKRARKTATQDAQRKMLKKSNNRATRAAAAAAKKLAEAAAKAVKELISALASLGGGTALFVVFSIVIVAGAFLASPLGILFADEQQADDTVPLATAIAEIQGEYHAELERLQNGDFVSVQIVGQAPDWREVVAVFASKTAGAEDGIDVFTLDEERVELLRQVFWDMCEITTATQTVDVPDSAPDDDVDDSHTGIALTITITAKTAEQMRLIYVFTKYQNDALDILLENLGSLNIPMGSLTISQEDAIALLENLPDDLDPARKAVVETAVQLVGRVSYFWGGKSLTLGWDDRWGTSMEVTAAGSGSTGTVRPFGLDCSGFVDWTFYNATNGSYYPGRGGGAATQHSYCTNISWSDAQPGDLVFYPDDSHVGIVGGKDADGNLLIVHCSGGANGVVITGAAGFTSVARPEYFS
ncbi:MAG: NlpC/P60 family protein [Oscillospiraceae bacterium]